MEIKVTMEDLAVRVGYLDALKTKYEQIINFQGQKIDELTAEIEKLKKTPANGKPKKKKKKG